MEKTGLKLKIDGLGYVDTRSEKDVSAVKSKAGKAFHLPFVKSVCVYDLSGVSHLYLKKLDGGGYLREEL